MRSPLVRTHSWDLILSVLGISAAALIFGGSLYLSGAVHSALEKLQNENSVGRVGSVLQAVDQNTHHLSEYTAGYAMWDDAYKFMESRDAAFLKSNYAESVLAATPVQLVAIYTLDDELLFATALNEDLKTAPVPASLKDFPKLEEFATLRNPGDFMGRIEWIDGQAYLLAICPITDSAGTAPIRGYLLFGTIVGEKMLHRLQVLTGCEVSVKAEKTPRQGAFQIRTSDLGIAEVSIEKNNGDLTSEAHAVFREDNPEQSSVAFRIELPAEASQTGRELGALIHTVFFLVAIGFLMFMGLSIREIYYRRTEINRRILEGEEMKAARRNAERLAKKAASADRAKSLFLAMMSHEIRTPLNAIIGYADLLHRNPSEELAGRLEIISHSGAALKRILDDILDFSKIEAGKLEIRRRPTSIRALVEEVVATYQAAVKVKGTHLVSKIHPEVPAYLMLDDLRVRQVLGNLVSNAVKFTNSGSISITVACEGLEAVEASPESRPADTDLALVITVEDDGIGVALKDEASLFEPFSQADTTSARHYEGTGLGLVICRRLCLLMGGQINFQRRPVPGSKFTIRLPSHSVSKPADILTHESALYARQKDDLSILIVDDNFVNARLLKAILKSIGRSGSIATSGSEAVAYFVKNSPEVIFMDIHMPGMDGIEATRQIRKIEKETGRPPCSIIAVTADALVTDGEDSREAGMDCHINKPIKVPEIVLMLSRLSDQKNQ